jgi:hypothetical protein
MAGSADAEDQGQSVETQSVRRREARAEVMVQKCKRGTATVGEAVGSAAGAAQ